MAAVAAKHRAQRRQRREWLLQHKDSIKAATDHYSRIDTGNVPDIAIRENFVRLPRARPPLGTEFDDPPESARNTVAARLKADQLSRPPITQLVMRRSNALALYLTAIYDFQLRYQPGAQAQNDRAAATSKSNNPSWASLAGMGLGPSYRARKSRIMRALLDLHHARLVDLPQTGHHKGYEHWRLLRDDGTERPYAVPKPHQQGMIKVPALFFYHGWHLALKPTEIAVILALVDRSTRYSPVRATDQEGVDLPPRSRWALYGISDETYSSVHELVEFGIVTLHDPMPSRRHGKLPLEMTGDNDDQQAPDPYRFVYHEAAFDRSAWQTVADSLAKSETPPRHDVNNDLYLLVPR